MSDYKAFESSQQLAHARAQLAQQEANHYQATVTRRILERRNMDTTAPDADLATFSAAIEEWAAEIERLEAAGEEKS